MKWMNSKGFSFVELLVSVTVLAVGGLSMAYFFSHGAKSNVTVRTFSSRDKVIDTIRTAASLPSSIRNSYLSNGALEACVTANPTLCNQAGTACGAPIEDCVSGVKHSLNLIGPLVTVTGLPVSSGPVAGTQNKPIYYDLTGTVCKSKTDPECVVYAWAEFSAQCPPVSSLGAPSAQCDVAEVITITFHIQPNLPSIAKLEEVGAVTNVAALTESVTTSVMKISGVPPTIITYMKPIIPTGPIPPTASHPTPLHCPGMTFQLGNGCTCGWGRVLLDPFNAICGNVGI